jgi:uncharacterized sulfatase
MSYEIKNILFLSVDSLRYDQLEQDGYSVAPTIKWLGNNGISCSNTFTNGPPTQFAFPSIFTSTMPLDFGGYDRGIKDRMVTLAEVLKEHKYSTAAFSISPWLSSFYGYNRGI